MKLPPEKFAPKKQGDGGKDLPTEAKKLQLNSAEELYAEIRDKNFNAVGSVLSKKAKVISAAFEVRRFGRLAAAVGHRLDCAPPGEESLWASVQVHVSLLSNWGSPGFLLELVPRPVTEGVKFAPFLQGGGSSVGCLQAFVRNICFTFFFFLIISYLTQEEAGCTINKRSSRIELVVWGESSKFRRRAGGGGAPPMP